MSQRYFTRLGIHASADERDIAQALFDFGEEKFARRIARAIVDGDDTWRRFAPFELVWGGGAIGRAAGR